MSTIPLTGITQLWRNFGLALGGAALITLGAKLHVPFWPVPMTLHVLAVFVVACGLGPRLGTAAMLAYLGAGAAGLPVFSGSPERGIGVAYMVGPTGGYLLGFLLAAWLTGKLGENRGTVGTALAMLAGLAVIHALGLAWLAHFVPAETLATVGLLPFLPGDLLKIALATAIIAGARRMRAAR